MKYAYTFLLAFALLVSPLAFAEESSSATGASASVQVSVTGSTGESTQATCDESQKPRLACPAGYSVQCQEAGGAYRWACLKSSASVDVQVTNIAPTPGATSNTGIEPDEIDISLEGEARVGGSGGGAGKVSMSGTAETTNPKLSVLLDPAVQAAIYIKLGDIKGESSARRGKVEYTWKVEEGESTVAGEYFLKIPPIAGDSDVEAGGTEDIAIGVGELQSKTIVVSGVQVRGWDPEKREEVLALAPKTAAEVKTEADLALYAASHAADSAPIEEVSFNYGKIVVKYAAQAKLLGFIPHSFVQTVTLDTDAEGKARVKVKMPWYSFLLSLGVSAEAIEEAAQAAGDGHKEWIEILSATDASVAAQASAYAEAFSTLKGSLDTAVKGSWNLKENVK